MNTLKRLTSASLLSAALAMSGASGVTASFAAEGTQPDYHPMIDPASGQYVAVPAWGLGNKGSPLHNTIGLGAKGSPLHNTIGIQDVQPTYLRLIGPKSHQTIAVPAWGLGKKGSPLHNTIGLGDKGSPLHNTIGLVGATGESAEAPSGYTTVYLPVMIPTGSAQSAAQQTGDGAEPVQCMINSIAALTRTTEDCATADGTVAHAD